MAFEPCAFDAADRHEAAPKLVTKTATSWTEARSLQAGASTSAAAAAWTSSPHQAHRDPGQGTQHSCTNRGESHPAVALPAASSLLLVLSSLLLLLLLLPSPLLQSIVPHGIATEARA